ncbi:hypothetical protein NPX13_g3233 [Xylaria arbuscula]|uniref:Uncharacterized protein n=1 Tax=Xylaria arbuscula TaxID=114810 RepID=A0A9W8NIX6_9PEZI|nr:hypothetical protein NPX13_g3233 [Xylaria arbuscula]
MLLTIDLAAELLFNLVSFLGLKSICAKVLEDRTAGAKFREELLSCKQNILAHSRAGACNERDGIIIAADKATDRVIEEAMQMKGMMGCDDWPTALSPLFPRIKALCNRGSLVGGPGLAWEALVEVAAFCMYQWDGGDARVQGFGEEDCDEFHDEVDKIMLSICEAQKQDGKIPWLQGRREEISGLQKKAEDQNGGSFKYRYQRSLQFLEQL